MSVVKRLGALMALMAIALFTPKAQASDLRLTVTDTLFSEYRTASGVSGPEGGDIYYGFIVNRLNMVASAGTFTASQRFDLIQFIDAPQASMSGDHPGALQPALQDR